MAGGAAGDLVARLRKKRVGRGVGGRGWGAGNGGAGGGVGTLVVRFRGYAD